MRRNTVSGTVLGLMPRNIEIDAGLDRYWECAQCGRPSTEYTEHTLCPYCVTGENEMSSDVVFYFYSDSNQRLAFDELQLLSLDNLEWDEFSIRVGASDYAMVGDVIDSIVSTYGGEEGL